jgi:hypothetical protein
MRQETSTERSWNGRNLKIAPVSPAEQSKRIRDAVAVRAFQICESRGCGAGHDAEDWQRAESEIVGPLNCGHLVLDDRIWLSTDVAYFEKGAIEICVEPRRLTICGTPRIGKPSQPPESGGSGSRKGVIFRFLDFPVEILPAQATAKFKGRFVEIDLPKAQAMRKIRGAKSAA